MGIQSILKKVMMGIGVLFVLGFVLFVLFGSPDTTTTTTVPVVTGVSSSSSQSVPAQKAVSPPASDELHRRLEADAAGTANFLDKRDYIEASSTYVDSNNNLVMRISLGDVTSQDSEKALYSVELSALTGYVAIIGLDPGVGNLDIVLGSGGTTVGSYHCERSWINDKVLNSDKNAWYDLVTKVTNTAKVG